MRNVCLLLAVIFGFSISAHAASRTVNLTVGYKTVNFTGSTQQALSVNQQIPAPILHFKEGDLVTLNVHNNMNQETALHWHGLLVPWQMDGVKGITQRGIKPGETFQYRFRLKQSGTYWYHAHAGLQEQRGLYGAFLIDPLKKPPYHYNKDYVVVLSDWSNTDPDQILANLKKEGEYYSPRFPLQPSLLKFIHDYRQSSAAERVTVLNDYKMMQQMRMGLYDFSDVAYDAFLLNGKTKSNLWRGKVKVGDVVRLRFIGAGGSTIFHFKIPDTMMQVVQLQGNNIKPYSVHDFTIAPGETVDVLVKITRDHPYLIYAESIDTVGAAYGSLITHANQYVNVDSIQPFPEPLPVTQTMMAMMMGKKIQGDTSPAQPVEHGGHDMSAMAHGTGMHHEMTMPRKVKPHHNAMQHTMQMPHEMMMPVEPTRHSDVIAKPESTYVTSVTPSYQHAKAVVKTNDPAKPVAGVINMELFGYMGQYIWFINGVPEYNAKPIILEPAKRYRFVFTNTSMMHHPMHIHGHWFILRKGEGEYDPLLHTIDVPPGATITADLDTDASGQWFFHCHLLYHMMTGMSRVFQYSTLLEIIKDEAKPQDIIKNTAYMNRPIVRVDEVRPIDVEMVKHPLAHQHGIWLASFVDIGIDPFKNLQKLTYKGLYGSDHNKLELFINDAEVESGSISEADMDIFYWRPIYQFWAIKGGLNYYYRPAASPYWQPGLGIEGLMPYFIDVDLRTYFYSGSAKLDLELLRDTQITNNFFLRLEVRSILATKTITHADIGSGLNQMRYIVRPYYRFLPGWNVFAEYEHESLFGSYQTIQRDAGHELGGNVYTVGLSAVL